MSCFPYKIQYHIATLAVCMALLGCTDKARQDNTTELEPKRIESVSPKEVVVPDDQTNHPAGAVVLTPELLKLVPSDVELFLVADISTLAQGIELKQLLLKHPQFAFGLNELTKLVGVDEPQMDLGGFALAGIDLERPWAFFVTESGGQVLVFPLTDAQRLRETLPNCSHKYTADPPDSPVFCSSNSDTCIVVLEKHALLRSKGDDFAVPPASSLADDAPFNKSVGSVEDRPSIVFVYVNPTSWIAARIEEQKALAELARSRETTNPEEREEAESEARRHDAAVEGFTVLLAPIERIVAVADMEDRSVRVDTVVTLSDGALLGTLFTPHDTSPRLLSLLTQLPSFMLALHVNMDASFVFLTHVLSMDEDLALVLVLTAGMALSDLELDLEKLFEAGLTGQVEMVVDAGDDQTAITAFVGVSDQAKVEEVVQGMKLTIDENGRRTAELESNQLYFDTGPDFLLISTEAEHAEKLREGSTESKPLSPEALGSILQEPTGMTVLLSLAAVAGTPGAYGLTPDEEAAELIDEMIDDDPHRDIPHSEAFLEKLDELTVVVVKLVELERRYMDRRAATNKAGAEAAGFLCLIANGTEGRIELQTYLFPKVTVAELVDLSISAESDQLTVDEQSQLDTLMMELTALEVEMWEIRAATLKTEGALEGDVEAPAGFRSISRRFGPGSFGVGK